MMQLRPHSERGFFENQWLKSHHSFSFGEYYDPAHMSFGPLRVINHDFIAGGTGFPLHPHRDMEIITYVLQGRVQHEDSLNNKTVIKAGEIQVMSAGTGIRHSEVNPDPDQMLELLQIWIVPSQTGLTPGYQQQMIGEESKRNQWVELVSPPKGAGVLKIHQDASLWATHLQAGKKITRELAAGRKAWVQVASGELTINGQNLVTGDGLALMDEKQMNFESQKDSEILVFDLK